MDMYVSVQASVCVCVCVCVCVYAFADIVFSAIVHSAHKLKYARSIVYMHTTL